jgi:pimeloyl-ACP methyl ester carboxylesterase
MPLRAAVALLFSAGLALHASAADRSTAVVSDPAYANPQRLVDIDHGRRLNIHCIGHGTPAVVFDAGLANWSQIWGLVQPAIAAHSRACTYDRAGLGFSDAPTRPGSSANAILEVVAAARASGGRSGAVP